MCSDLNDTPPAERCGCLNMSKKLHQRSVTFAHFLRPHFFFFFLFVISVFIVVINRWWAQSRRSRCSDCSDARLLWRGEDVSGSPAAYILCKHSTARPHQLFPLTISTPSNFLCFSPLTAFFSPPSLPSFFTTCYLTLFPDALPEATGKLTVTSLTAGL